MKQYKRLTNNNSDEYDTEYDFCCGCQYFGEPCGCNRPNGTCDNYDRFLETYNRLSELEDKIEKGTLVELPCKVGTTIYQIYKDCSNCSHFKETGWEYDCWCDFDSEESKTMFERVKEFAEVFTPNFIVRDMCDLIPDEIWENIESTFLEPSCGNGTLLLKF